MGRHVQPARGLRNLHKETIAILAFIADEPPDFHHRPGSMYSLVHTYEVCSWPEAVRHFSILRAVGAIVGPLRTARISPEGQEELLRRNLPGGQDVYPPATLGPSLRSGKTSSLRHSPRADAPEAIPRSSVMQTGSFTTSSPEDSSMNSEDHGIDISKYQGRITRSSAHNLSKPLGVARWFRERCEEIVAEEGRGRIKDVPNVTRVAQQLKRDFGTVDLATIVEAMELFLDDLQWLDSPYPAWSQFYRQRVELIADVERLRLGESSEWDEIARETNQ